MTKKIFSAICVMVTLSVVLTGGLVSVLLYERHLSEIKLTIRSEADYIASFMSQRYVPEAELMALSKITRGRVTWVSEDGTVLFDSVSQPAIMENHAARREIKLALETGMGEDTRLSRTLNETSYYFARRMTDGTVLRVAYSTHSLYGTMSSTFITLGLLLCIVLAASLMLSRKITQRIVAPINRLDLTNPLVTDSYEELYPLLSRINSQNAQISKQMQALSRMQEEFSAIIENMREGLLVISSDATILSINPSAAELMGVSHQDCVGKYLLNYERSEEIRMVIERLEQKKSSEIVFSKAGKNYRLLANPVSTGGSILLMMDVTAQMAAEQLRREFSANVSHELKTPLQSISGYAEIMKSGLVKQEDYGEFIARIYHEAQRMIALVEDIIALSHLDEGESLPTERVELLSVVREAVDRLQPSGEASGITILVSGEPVYINGVRRLLAELVYNLCDNAIKYNQRGGRVTASIERAENGDILLTVSDTGVGIAPEHQNRVFERFYRVDKSHSKQTGGTGLGLSIVKHAAAFHKAKVTLTSSENQGTTVMVRFPAQS